ncbi:MAG TPA: hypothetical protein ENN68_01060 [Methanomicrobia archaeon]|nr:hypothetical protein [Methanomicrobia archaeon]
MAEDGDTQQQVAAVTAEWESAFQELQTYLEPEAYAGYRIVYEPNVWYQNRNPALIFPEAHEMRFSTPNHRVPFDYYPTELAKLGILAHNFAYLADIEEFYPNNFVGFLREQQRYIMPLQRANLRAAQYVPDAIIEVTRQGVRSFVQAVGSAAAFGVHEEPLVLLETLGVLGMPRRDDVLKFFKELYDAAPRAFKAFMATPFLFSFAGLATVPVLNAEPGYGIRDRKLLHHAKALIGAYASGNWSYEAVNAELERVGYTTTVVDSGYSPEKSVHLNWVRLDPALERVQRTITEYERKAEQSEYCCYADMVTALKRIYEQEQTVRQAYE